MADEKLVKFIVGSYELPGNLRDKILRIATRRLDELSIGGFDNVYRYLANLVESFRMPFNERRALRLDSPLNPNTKTTFLDMLGVQDLSLPENRQDEQPIQHYADAADLIAVLEMHIGSHELELMKQLLGQAENKLELPFHPEEITQYAEQIQMKLEELVSRYEREGRIIIPPRPIIDIQFNPLVILFGRRDFKGDQDPLGYFRKYEKVYGWMSRSQLFDYDCGLYQSLRRKGQLKEAIPFVSTQGRIGLSPSMQNEIIAAHKLYKGVLIEAAKNLPCSAPTISKYWKKAGLRHINKKNANNLSQEQINGIIEAYKSCHGNIAKMARQLHYSEYALHKYIGKPKNKRGVSYHKRRLTLLL